VATEKLVQDSERRANATSTETTPSGAVEATPATAGDAAAGAEASRDSTPPTQSAEEARMEPIEEENSPKSFDRSFSFVSQCRTLRQWR